MRRQRAAGKRVQALGGAKNHLIVLPDADMQAVVDALISAAFGSAGERCMAISVAVLVGEGADWLVDVLAEKVREIRVGPAAAATSQMGPLISAAHLQRVRAYIDSGVEEGAQLVVDGRGAAHDSRGFFLGASLFDHVEPQMRIYREEIFGPVLCVVRAASLEHAIDLVNRHEFGNGVALFTSDGGAAGSSPVRFAWEWVGINVPIPVPMGFSQLRRLEALAVRGHACVRSGRCSVLHPGQDYRATLAAGGGSRSRHFVLNAGGRGVRRVVSVWKI